MGQRFGFRSLLGTALVGALAVVGFYTYNLGLAHGIAESGQLVAAPGSGVPVVVWPRPWGFGFGFFPFFPLFHPVLVLRRPRAILAWGVAGTRLPLRRTARRAHGSDAACGRTDDVKHILVVDDEPRIAEIARDYLERAGYRVTLAGNGADALAIARARQPDLIVLDLGLPQMDGLDVTRALRRQSNVPIIMLTARVEESDKLIGLELGADDYVTKPFSPKELVARVRAVFRRSRCGAGARRRHPRRRRDPRQAAHGGERRRPHIDLTADRVRAAGDAGASAGPRVHAGAAARRHPRRGGGIVRPRDRRARQEPAPQARARSTESALRAHRARRRLQVRRLRRHKGHKGNQGHKGKARIALRS